MAEFGAAISIGGKETVDNDEVECLLANMIYKVRLGVFPRLSLITISDVVGLFIKAENNESVHELTIYRT